MPDLEVVILGVLVLVTAYYAVQTRQTVKAMRESSQATLEATERSIRAQQQPRLALQVYSLGEQQAGVEITNVGGGPALDADLAIKFIPHAHGNRETIQRRHRFAIISAPRLIRVAGPQRKGGEEGETITRKELCQEYDRVVVEGTMTDSTGQTHEVHEAIEDLRPFADAGKEAVSILDPQARTQRAVEFHLQGIQGELTSLDGLESELSSVDVQLSELRKLLDERMPKPPPTEDDVPF